MYQLFTVNILIILMDFALLGVEFANLYIIETTFKGVVYSIKLKLEFAVLGKLVQFVTGTQSGSTRNRSVAFKAGNDHGEDILDFVDQSRSPTDVTHAVGAPSGRRKSRADVNASDLSLAQFEHVESLK